MKKALNCFITAACIFVLLLSEQKHITCYHLKGNFSTKIELVTQAYTKIACVNTEKKTMGTQHNFSQLKQGCCKSDTLVDTKRSLCNQRNLCIDTKFLIGKSYVEYTKVFSCVLTRSFLCKLVSWVLFWLRKLFFRQECYIDIIYIYI